jgi:hypothetical protein
MLLCRSELVLALVVSQSLFDVYSERSELPVLSTTRITISNNYEHCYCSKLPSTILCTVAIAATTATIATVFFQICRTFWSYRLKLW